MLSPLVALSPTPAPSDPCAPPAPHAQNPPSPPARHTAQQFFSPAAPSSPPHLPAFFWSPTSSCSHLSTSSPCDAERLARSLEPTNAEAGPTPAPSCTISSTPLDLAARPPPLTSSASTDPASCARSIMTSTDFTIKIDYDTVANDETVMILARISERLDVMHALADAKEAAADREREDDRPSAAALSGRNHPLLPAGGRGGPGPHRGGGRGGQPPRP